MDDKARARLQVAQAVLGLSRSADFRASVADTNPDGEHVIIPALPDDQMGQFFDQFCAATGSIYVATLDGDGVAIMTMSRAHAARHAVATDADECPIYRHTELMMVISYLRARRTPLSIYEAPGPVVLELVDEGRDVPLARV